MKHRVLVGFTLGFLNGAPARAVADGGGRGILEKLDSERTILEVCRLYDHERDAALYTASTKNSTILGFFGHAPLLVRGHLASLDRYVRRIADVWRVLVATGAQDRLAVDYFFAGLLMCNLVRLDFRDLAAEVAQAVGLGWEGPVPKLICEKMAQMAPLFGDLAGLELYMTLLLVLPAFLASDPDHVGGEGAVASEAVHAALRNKEEVVAALDTYVDTLSNGDTGVVELCALAAERCGDDDLATFYATQGALEGFYAVKPQPRASCRALLGRVAKRREGGDPEAARGHFRAAAEDLIATAANPILVLRIVEDWRSDGRGATVPAGEDGENREAPEEDEPGRLVAAACAILGRQAGDVQREFRESRGQGRGGL